MNGQISPTEEEMRANFNRSRLESDRGEIKDNNSESNFDSTARLSLLGRFKKHWPILALAGIFDLFALIPFISAVINICFGAIMFMYFGKKRIISGVVLPIGILSVFDFIISLLPVNIASTVIRIALKETVG